MHVFDGVKRFFKEQIRSRLTSGAALIVVVILCVVSLALQYFKRDDAISPLTIAGIFVVPFQEGVNEIGDFLYRTEQDRMDKAQAAARIEELEKENAELRNRVFQLSELENENRELRELLYAVDQIGAYTFVEATVIGNDGVNIFERFLINRGSADGIAVNMNVVNGDGLIGIVTSAGLNYAVVTTIIEDGLNVSAMTKNSHDNCIVTGDMAVSGIGTLKLDNALASVDLEKDSTLVTSDISDRFLPGLLIGYAENVKVNAGNLTKSGTVRTAVDFSNLKEVLVITTLKEEPKEE